MSLTNTLTRSEPRERGSDARPTIKPLFEVREKDDAYALTVYMPGVAKDGVEITAEEGNLIIYGRRNWKAPEAWTPIYVESFDADFELVLAHDNAVDVDKINAELHDGVLRINLPKTEALKPRKIPVS